MAKSKAHAGVEARLSASRWVQLAASIFSLCLVAAVATYNPAQAAEEAEFQTKAKYAFLMDADSGAVLFQHGADELMQPASMSKLMTLTVLFKALKAGQFTQADEFVVSEYAWRTGGAKRPGSSAMMVPLNSRATIQDLVLGIIVQSGNDAAIVVAEGIAGSEQAFARMMNEEARRIGLKQSTFSNATGLPDASQLMTAREIGLLAQHIMKTYPDFYPLFSTREFTFIEHRIGSKAPLPHKFINRNPLLFANIGVDGLKTGSTKESGYGIVASAKQGDRRLIAVINGAASAQERKDEGSKLLEWGFRNFASFRLFDANERVGDVRVWGGSQFYVPVSEPNGVSVVLPRFPANQKLKAELIYASPIKAPVMKGDQIAHLRVTSPPLNVVNDVPLYASEDVPAASMWRKGLDTLALLAVSWMK